jgi:hypothetical protein
MDRSRALPGFVGLVLRLDELGIEPVRHGSFVGLKGPGLGRLPQAVWDGLHAHEAALRRLLPDSATPFRQRG